jgi:16S rRNA (uracil1498-N3)-methyltransferase
MRRRFFVEEFRDGLAALRGEAAHHLARVLRAEAGQLYELSDGKRVWLARTEHVSRDEIRFSLVEQLPTPAQGVRIDLLLAIVKFDRFEWALEKATELGADTITPLAAERSERGLVAAAAKRAERWQKILMESAQQSRRLRVPALTAAAKPREAFRGVTAQQRVLLSEKPGAASLREIFEPVASQRETSRGSSVAFAIGPEGGWTDAEFAAARESGFVEAGLGSNILRTETAVCAALAAAQYALGATGTSSDT